ncbi:NAD(P)-binding protein [Durotheca rogersii]|uniref:NAD(P)-binding protein n=1 Tax=Durotheca rogersii TaxID=419775 RepID=UPI00221E6579|nr:NAD(P)-binding protein [Durotheca rogersii]KAI5864223.1 NAD(P)-binding protein [Durotheca rogersii]
MEAPAPKPYILPPDAVWFITGCSSGIGEALAQHVATKTPSNRVVATARNPAALSSIPDGPRVLKLALDVTSEAAIGAAFDAALARFGRVDVVINNAGYAVMGDAEASGPGDPEGRELLDTNFWGAVDVTKRALGVMRDANARGGRGRGGVIINVSSMGGFFGSPGSAFYHASKFALEGFAEAVAKELDPAWNIHVCNAEPGGVRTRYAASARRLEPRHPAYAADAALGTNRMLAFLGDPSRHDVFAAAPEVAAAIYQVAAAGRRIPIRVPLGLDAWGAVAAELDRVRADLDEFKELSCGMGRQTADDVAKLIG